MLHGWYASSTLGLDYETEERSYIHPYVPTPRKVDPNYPHDCKCGSKAYIGAFSIECLNRSCQHYCKSK